MQISTVLCICIFLMCCTGTAERPCRLLRVFPGRVAALILLVMCASAFDCKLSRQFSCNLGVVVLFIVTTVLCLHGRNAFWTILLSLVCGVAAWALNALFPTAHEPGALLCLPAALSGRFLPLSPRKGFLCTQLAPLCYGLVVSAEDWYLFDYLRIQFGNALQFDMQLCGMVLFAVLLLLPQIRIHPIQRTQTARMIRVQKEG